MPIQHGPSMDLGRLELLIQVAAAGSLSKAATVLGIAQPALGRQIKKLEEECGLRLLYRHGRGVSLTPEGQSLIERARPLVRQLMAIPADLQAARLSPEGLVTLGLTPTVCHLLGLNLLTALRQKYPKLMVHIVSGYSGYVHEWLVDGRLDMAILHDARRSPAVVVDPLAAAELCIIAPCVDTAFDTLASATLAALREVPMALPTRNHGLRRTIEYAAARENVKLNVCFEVDTLDLLKQIVAAGLACTVLARSAVLNELAAGTLSARPILTPRLRTKLVLATAVQRPVTHAVRAVESEIRMLFASFIEQGDLYGIVHANEAQADHGAE